MRSPLAYQREGRFSTNLANLALNGAGCETGGNAGGFSTENSSTATFFGVEFLGELDVYLW
jgi:hypothetical protein